MSAPVANPQLMTRDEAAAYLGLRPQTLAVWACNKRYGLPVIKVGGRVRYRKTDLDTWLESRTQRDSAAAAETVEV